MQFFHRKEEKLIHIFLPSTIFVSLIMYLLKLDGNKRIFSSIFRMLINFSSFFCIYLFLSYIFASLIHFYYVHEINFHFVQNFSGGKKVHPFSYYYFYYSFLQYVVHISNLTGKQYVVILYFCENFFFYLVKSPWQLFVSPTKYFLHFASFPSFFLSLSNFPLLFLLLHLSRLHHTTNYFSLIFSLIQLFMWNNFGKKFSFL